MSRAAAYEAVDALLDLAWPITHATSTERSRKARADPLYREDESITENRNRWTRESEAGLAREKERRAAEHEQMRAERARSETARQRQREGLLKLRERQRQQEQEQRMPSAAPLETPPAPPPVPPPLPLPQQPLEPAVAARVWVEPTHGRPPRSLREMVRESDAASCRGLRIDGGPRCRVYKLPDPEVSLVVKARRATTAYELRQAHYSQEALGGSLEGSLPKHSYDFATPTSPLVYVSVRPRHRPKPDGETFSTTPSRERFVCLCDASREEIRCVEDAHEEARYQKHEDARLQVQAYHDREAERERRRALKRKLREEGELRASDPETADVSGGAAAHAAFAGWAVRKRHAQ